MVRSALSDFPSCSIHFFFPQSHLLSTMNVVQQHATFGRNFVLLHYVKQLAVNPMFYIHVFKITVSLLTK